MAKTQNGVIGIPDVKDKTRYTSCRYEITCNKGKSRKYGLNGGKIVQLTISVNGKVTASYDKGWITEPEDEPSQLALCILLYSNN